MRWLHWWRLGSRSAWAGGASACSCPSCSGFWPTPGPGFDPALLAWAIGQVGDLDDAFFRRLEIEGVEIDVVPTLPLPVNRDELPDEDLDRLFVMAHRWVLETAEETGVSVVGLRVGQLASVRSRHHWLDEWVKSRIG